MDFHLFHEDGSEFEISQISNCLLNEVCDDKLLGDNNIKVLITETATRDRDLIMGIV